MSFINLIQSCINDANTYNSNRYINNLCLSTFAIKRHFHNFLLCNIVIQNKIIQNTSCIHFFKKRCVQARFTSHFRSSSDFSFHPLSLNRTRSSWKIVPVKRCESPALEKARQYPWCRTHNEP